MFGDNERTSYDLIDSSLYVYGFLLTVAKYNGDESYVHVVCTCGRPFNIAANDCERRRYGTHNKKKYYMK